MSENEKKKKGSLDFSRRDFLRLAGTGVMAAAAAALPGGTAMAAEAKPAHGSRAKNKFKATGMQKGGKADLLILGNVITMDEYKPFAEAEEETGYFDMRNALAHLHIVHKDDYKRIADYNVMSVVGMMWIEGDDVVFKQEIDYVGKERAYNDYPIKSLIESGAVVGSHSDYPVSPCFSAAHTVCYGALGCLPNLTVFDRDFLKDDFRDIEHAKCLATFVEGELVYHA